MLCQQERTEVMVPHRAFAVESAVNELADKLHMDPFEIRFKNIVKEGDVMPAYYGQVNTSCALDRCLAKVKEMINGMRSIL